MGAQNFNFCKMGIFRLQFCIYGRKFFDKILQQFSHSPIFGGRGAITPFPIGCLSLRGGTMLPCLSLEIGKIGNPFSIYCHNAAVG